MPPACPTSVAHLLRSFSYSALASLFSRDNPVIAHWSIVVVGPVSIERPVEEVDHPAAWDWSGRELRSSPLRYGNEHILVARILVDETILASSGSSTNPMPRTWEPMKRLPGVGSKAVWRAADGTRFGRNAVIPVDRLLIKHEWRVPRPSPQPDVSDFEVRCARPRSAGDCSGMTHPSAVSWSSPTSRVSPWAIVFVARKPRIDHHYAVRACCPQEEVCTEVGTALCFPLAEVLDEIVPIVRAEVASDLLATHERRIADERIEPAPFEQSPRGTPAASGRSAVRS